MNCLLFKYSKCKGKMSSTMKKKKQKQKQKKIESKTFAFIENLFISPFESSHQDYIINIVFSFIQIVS